jgi:hypothetical protein
MSLYATIPTAKLQLHPRAEDIPPMPPDEYDALVLDIEKRGIVVPLDVLSIRNARGMGCHPRDAQEVIVLDGRHRLRAARALGIETVDVREVEAVCWHGDEDEGLYLHECPSHAFEYMVKAATLRRHLTTRQRRELAAKVIITDPQRSDRQVAATVGVSPTTAGTVRRELEEAGDVSKLDTRTDSLGREQPARKDPTASVVREIVRERFRSEAAESEAEMQEATAHWSPAQRAAVSPERLRQRGEFMRLTADLAHLPEATDFAHDHRDLPARAIEQADAAHAWLSGFLSEWRAKP